MISLHQCIIGVLGVFALCVTGCDRGPASQLQGQSNTTIRFYGLVVDQDGKPLQGADIEYQVDAYPKDWTYETRGRPYDVSFVSATSDENGRFEFEATGCILRLKKADKKGYRHLFEMDQSDKHPSVLGYSLISWGNVQYASDPDNPAVFVFVKDGVKEVSALPSIGGSRAYGRQWIPNEPACPQRPSLKDVVYKPASTQPTSQPATQP